MRVAVTGASGFVGGAVARHLADAGWTVHPFGRRVVELPRYRRWDLTDGPLDDPPEVDAVVHAAAWVGHGDGPPGVAHAVNVTGTRHLLDTWPDARFVHVSSASVYHPWRPQHGAAEAEAPEPTAVRWPGDYARSKALAERLVRARRPDAVLLRPHAVYGPGDTTLLPRLLAAVRGGVLLLPGSGRQRHALTSVHALAEACRLAVASSAAGPVNVADADALPLAEGLTRAFAALGRRVRLVPVGYRPALAAARVARLRRDPVLTPYTAAHLALERTFDLTRARDRLGYRPAPTDFGILEP